jgi:hypothetical protein
MRPFIFAAVLSLGLGLRCAAQSSSSPSASSSKQQEVSKQTSASATSSSSTPSGAAPAQGQPGDQAPSKATNKTEDGEKKKPKKVWTNEELRSSHGAVSVVGDSSNGANGTVGSSSSANSSCCTQDTAYDRLLESYRSKLSPLRETLADLDRKIQQAKEAKGNAREDTAAWIKVYEGKRSDVSAKIAALEDEAERKGLLPGDVRQ